MPEEKSKGCNIMVFCCCCEEMDRGCVKIGGGNGVIPDIIKSVCSDK